MKKIQYETPLGVALETLNKGYKDSEIRVCDNCGVPMLWTFYIAYCERYCLNCGYGGGMMGTGTDVELTAALKYEKKVIDDVWNAIYKNLIPHSRYTKKNCKKCVSGDHNTHLSRSEKLRDKTAQEILKKLTEGFAAKREIKEK